MDRDTIISLASLPDSRTRATVSRFFCEAQGALELLTVQAAASSPDDRITQCMVTRFVNIAISVAGDSEAVQDVSLGGVAVRQLAAVG